MELESLFCHLNLEGFPEKLNAVLDFFADCQELIKKVTMAF
jgi:hypothetical protein